MLIEDKRLVGLEKQEWKLGGEKQEGFRKNHRKVTRSGISSSASNDDDAKK
jgi:hypothetical protein